MGVGVEITLEVLEMDLLAELLLQLADKLMSRLQVVREWSGSARVISVIGELTIASRVL
jgi:hypothetical protein